MSRLSLLVALLVLSVLQFVLPCSAQVIVQLGDAELEYDPATGQPTEAWQVPLLISGGTQPVLAFTFEVRIDFNGFQTTGVPIPCGGIGTLTNDNAAAAISTLGFDESQGVFAGAEYVQVQEDYSPCFYSNTYDWRFLALALIESLQAPFVGQALAAPTQVGVLTISAPNALLINDIGGASLTIVDDSAFQPVVITEVTYVDGSFAPLTFQAGAISFTRANSFRRGRFDAGASYSITDVVKTLLYLFGGGAAPACLDSVDTNDDGVLDVSDPLYSLLYLFAGGAPPPSPHTQCGVDQTADALDCAADICT